MLGTVHHGDCLDIMRRMPAGSVDLILTSPPYNLRNSSGSGIRNASPTSGLWRNTKLRDGYAGGYTDDLPREEYVSWQRDCLRAMERLLHRDGAIFYVHKRRVQYGLLEDPRDILDGFPLRQEIIWSRPGGINVSDRFFLPTYEVIYLIAMPAFRLAQGAYRWGDVWRLPPARNNPHPAPFPLRLAKRCIRLTNARIILDPFMGSGTTAIAAEKLGRQWIGIENAKEYVNFTNERLARWRSASSTSAAESRTSRSDAASSLLCEEQSRQTSPTLIASSEKVTKLLQKLCETV